MIPTGSSFLNGDRIQEISIVGLPPFDERVILAFSGKIQYANYLTTDPEILDNLCLGWLIYREIILDAVPTIRIARLSDRTCILETPAAGLVQASDSPSCICDRISILTSLESRLTLIFLVNPRFYNLILKFSVEDFDQLAISYLTYREILEPMA